MRIPHDQTLFQSHATTYGAGALELIPGYDQPGCPRLYHFRYVENRGYQDPFAWQLDYGKAVHGALDLMEQGGTTPEDALREVWPSTLGPERYAEALEDLDRVLTGPALATHTVATELYLEAPLYEDPDYGVVKIGGYIDRLAVELDLSHVLYFDDYKTDRRPPSYENLDRWIQGRWYAALIMLNASRFVPEHQVGRVEVVGRYEAVKWYGLERRFTRADVDVFLAWCETIARRILRDDSHEPRLNPGCSWCPIRFDCPAMLKLPGDGTALLERMTKLKIEKRVQMLADLVEVRKKIETTEGDIKTAALDKARAEGEFVAGKLLVSVSESRKRWADPRRVHDLMGDDFYDAVTVKLGSIDDWMKRHPDDRKLMEAVIAEMPKENLSIEEAPE